MADTRAAHRYALAIMEVAVEQGILDAVSRDFELLQQLFNGSQEFALFVKSPIVNTRTKKRVLEEILRGRVTSLTNNFVLLLAIKDRETLLATIVQQFFKLRDQRQGILTVMIRTAVGLTEYQKSSLIQRLEARTQKTVRPTFVVDPTLQGGFTVRYDDTVLDASVRHQLDLLWQRLVGGRAS